MTDKELLEKAAHRFRLIADDTNRITSGNLSHNLTCLRGFALRAAESIEKHLQEEPVSEDLGEYINELSKQFPEVSFAMLSGIADMVSRWQRNQDAKNKLPKVINRTDLDEFAYQCAYDMSNDWVIDNPTWHDVEDACKLGAKWQKEQDQSTIELAEDHAMLAGMEKAKKQMMAKSIEAVVSQVPCSNEIILYNPSSVDKYYLPQEMNKLGLNKGDKVKLVIIKED